MGLTRDEVRAWADLVRGLCGVQLDDSKGYLLESRLADLARETGSATLSELFFKVRSDATGVLKGKVADAITTGETSFFRDTSPFDLLRHKVLPELIDLKRKAMPGVRRVPLRIWSAACSSGQEVYSTAIVARELLKDQDGIEVSILGTDVSNRAVAKASRGVYGRLEIDRGLARDQVQRWFVSQADGWKVRDEVRALATFRTLNLLQPFTLPAKFDVVLCRNVAIYFSDADKRRLFDRIGQALEPHGYLIIGSTESITGLCRQFEARRHLRAVFYQLSAPAAGRAA